MSDYLRVDKNQLLQMPFASYVTFQGINQPPILVPGQTNQLRYSITNLKKPPNTYYGIGGDTETFRTLIVLLALSRYRTKIQQLSETSPKIVLYDAYSYDFLNQIDGYTQLRDIWKVLLDILEKNKEEVETKIAKRRKIYGRMADMIGVGIGYIDANWLLRKQEYEEILFELLDNPSPLTWELLVPLSYRDKIASLLYVPMEIAEALTLKQIYGIKLKIGDKKEKGFDNLIYREDRDWLFAYTPPAITPKGERAPYRTDDINFDMTEEEARNFLEVSPEKVKQQFCWLLSELGKNSGNLTEDVIAIFSAIRGENDA